MTSVPEKVVGAELAASLRIIRGSGTPVYRQLKFHIAHLVSSRRLPEGTVLPSVRECAGALGIAPATVQRAYAELQRDGILVGEPRTGVVVSLQGDEAPRRHARARLHEVLSPALDQCTALGVSGDEIENFVRHYCQHLVEHPVSLVFATTNLATAAKYEAILREELASHGVSVSSIVVSESDLLLGTDLEADIVVTLVTTLGLVRERCERDGVAVFPLFVELAGSFAPIVMSIPRTARLGLVANEYFLATASALFASFCPNGMDDFTSVSVEDSRALRRMLSGSDVIIHTIGARDVVRAMSLQTGRADQRLIEVDYRPVRSSLDALREQVDQIRTSRGRERTSDVRA